MSKKTQKMEVPAIKVTQWLGDWDRVAFDPQAHQSKPAPYFYLLSLSAPQLKSLTGVHHRTTKSKKPRSADHNVQRWHDRERSQAIRDFVEFGYPLCELGGSQREGEEATLLRKPGGSVENPVLAMTC